MNTEQTYQCEGYDFTINSQFMFFVPELGTAYSAHDQMAAVIKRAKAAKAKAPSKKLSISALTNDGEAVTITGVHVGNGSILFTPKKGSIYTIYPFCPLIQEAILKLNAARETTGKLNCVLERFQVRSPATERGYSIERLPERIAEVEQKMADMLAKANSTTLAEELKTAKEVRLRF